MPRTVSEPERRATAPSGLVAVDGRTFPLRESHIDACAGGGIARTTLRQSYENRYDEPLEVIYTMPLPADGAVIGYTVLLGETRIVGEIETRRKAEEAYAKALEEGRTGGLLQQERADTFTQKLGNVPPRTPVDVEIVVLHPVAFHAPTEGLRAEWEYRFPTVVGVRYEGAPGRVPDREKLDVPRATDVGTGSLFTFDLTVADGAPDAIAVRSSSHTLVQRPNPAGPGTHVRLDESSSLNRDVTVCWKGVTLEVGAHLIEGPGLAGDDGRYGLLTIVPPDRPAGIFRRDLTLLLDASGSMSGFPLDSARELSVRLIESLGPEDRFEITTFASSPVPLVAGPVPATPENVRRAVEALRGVQAQGATEMGEAIKSVLRPLREDSQRQVIVITDGYIGFEHEIVRHVLEELPEGARLHMAGVGSAPNRALTRNASRAGRGVELILTKPEDIEVTSTRLLAATAAPVLTDVTVEGTAVQGSAPARPTDLFAARPVMVALSLRPEGGEVRVSGRMSGSTEPWVQTVIVAPATGADDQAAGLPLGALFGREAIEDAEMYGTATVLEQGGVEIERTIEALGLRHRIPSRCTSLVAVAEVPSVDPRQPRRRERLAVEMPEGVSAEGAGLVARAGRYGAGRIAAALPMLLSASMPGADLSGVEAISRPSVRGRAADKWRIESASAPEAAPPPAPLRGRILHLLPDGLIFEFECPQGYRHPKPGKKLTVLLPSGGRVQAEVLDIESTYPGQIVRGLTVRLHLRFFPPEPLKPGETLLVTISPRVVIELVVEA